MGVRRHSHQRHHHHHHIHYIRLSTLTAFTLLLFTSASSAIALTQLGEEKNGGSGALDRDVTQMHRRLGGPGSAPPSCRSKCGRCWPCKAVHVPIQPGVSIPLEYYPEAWRCKCDNKLFMP